MPQPQLTQIESALAGEFPIQALPPSDGAPLGQLAVTLDTDEQGRDRALYLLLVPPVNDEDLYGLQFFAPLPFRAVPQNLDALARLLLLINSAVPLVGFGLNEENGWIFFRCILPIAQGRALDATETLHATWLIFSCLDRFGDIVEAVSSGQIDYPQARSVVQGILSQLDEMLPDESSQAD